MTVCAGTKLELQLRCSRTQQARTLHFNGQQLNNGTAIANFYECVAKSQGLSRLSSELQCCVGD